MSDIILLDKDFALLKRVKKDALSWLPASEHGVFRRGFDTWMSRHSDEAKRQLAGEFRKMTLTAAKQVVRELLGIFKSWEADNKEREDGKMGMSPDGNDGDGDRNAALSGVGTSGGGPGDGDSGAASTLSV